MTMKNYQNRCEACGSENLVTTFSRIDMQVLCLNCNSIYSTYFRKDCQPFGFPAEWGQVVAIQVETAKFHNAYQEIKRRIERIGEVCHQVLEGRLTDQEGFTKIEKDYREMVESPAPSFIVDQAVFYIFKDKEGNVRRARIIKGDFEEPMEIEGENKIDAYHYWAVDMMPKERGK